MLLAVHYIFTMDANCKYCKVFPMSVNSSETTRNVLKGNAVKRIVIVSITLLLIFPLTLIACKDNTSQDDNVISSSIQSGAQNERIIIDSHDIEIIPEFVVSQAKSYNPADYRRTGIKPEELPVTITYEETEDIPKEVYDFVINYMQVRETSEAEASQYIKFFGEHSDFMMSISKESISWVGEWAIDRFEKIDDKLYVFFQHYVQGFDPEEIYTGPTRPSFYMPFFVYIAGGNMCIVQGFEWLPQECRDRLNPEDYITYIFDMDPNDIVDVEDVIRFQGLLGVED